MNDDLHNIDDLFKKALEEHTELPSLALWDNIDKGLDKKKVISISKKYNTLKWAAAMLLLFSISMAMYVIHIHTQNKELVKQGDAGKVNQHTQTSNTLKKHSDTFTQANMSPIKNNSNTELKKVNKNNSLITAANTDSFIEKKLVSNADQSRNGLAIQAKTALPAAIQKNGNIAKLNQHASGIKTRPVIRLEGDFAGTEPANNNTENLYNLNKSKTVNQQQPDNKNEDSVLSKKKNTIEIAEMLPQHTPGVTPGKPFSYFPPPTTGNELKTSGYNKTVVLKQPTVKKDNGSFFSVTMYYSPDLVSTNVKDDAPRFREDDRHEIERDEKIKSSASLGVLIGYTTRKSWVVESGITFTTRNNYIQPKTIYARPDNNGNINYRFNCSSGYSFFTFKSAAIPVSGDSIRALGAKNTLQYVGVPVNLKYKITKGKISLLPGIGISANFLSKGQIETTIATNTGNEGVGSKNIVGLKELYFTGSASVGAQYNLNKTLALTFIPTGRFALSSINKDAPVKTYLNSIGLVMGAVIKL